MSLEMQHSVPVVPVQSVGKSMNFGRTQRGVCGRTGIRLRHGRASSMLVAQQECQQVSWEHDIGRTWPTSMRLVAMAI